MALKHVDKNVFRNKAGKYVVRVRDANGNWYPILTFDRLVDARHYRDELLAQRANNKTATPKEVRELDLNGYWQVWHQECRSHVSEGWRLTQEKIATQHLLPLMGNKKILDIRNADIGTLMTQLEAKGLGAQSRRHVYNLVRKLMEDAVQEFEILDRNPITRKHKPRVVPKERPHLNRSEVIKLLNVSKNESLGPAIWTACLCGLRSEAIVALRWVNVFIDNTDGKYYLNICEAYKRKTGKIEPPKGKRSEAVPIPGVLADYLRSIRNQTTSDFVCPSQTGGMLPYKSLYYGVRKLCKAAGITEVGTHALRHSTSELFVQEGGNLEDIRRLLHHRSPQTTLRYIHRSEDRLHDLSQKVSAAMGEDLKQSLSLVPSAQTAAQKGE